ncbi:MAG: hypothetical protein IMY86_13870 [Chloroflexi bacterium]|nr:hypothetical protein [Chloroflexota bacterium]
MLHFVHDSDRVAWRDADRRLREIVGVAQDWLDARYGPCVLTVTSFLRLQDRGSPHGYHRAIDIAAHTQLPRYSYELPAGAAEALTGYLNRTFAYSDLPGKEGNHIAIFGEIDPSGAHDDHIHIGVPPLGERVSLRG